MPSVAFVSELVTDLVDDPDATESENDNESASGNDENVARQVIGKSEVEVLTRQQRDTIRRRHLRNPGCQVKRLAYENCIIDWKKAKKQVLELNQDEDEEAEETATVSIPKIRTPLATIPNVVVVVVRTPEKEKESPEKEKVCRTHSMKTIFCSPRLSSHRM